jgi:hypothetical protein
MLRRVALVRTDVSEERRASIIRVTKIGELGATPWKFQILISRTVGNNDFCSVLSDPKRETAAHNPVTAGLTGSYRLGEFQIWDSMNMIMNPEGLLPLKNSLARPSNNYRPDFSSERAPHINKPWFI